MSQELIRAVTALADRLGAVSTLVEALREDLRSVAEALLETRKLTAPPSPQPGDQVKMENDAEPPKPELPVTLNQEPAKLTPRLESVHHTTPLPELTLGRSRPPESEARLELPPGATKALTTDAALPAVEARCRLKAEGLRWAATRRRRIDEGADFRVEIAPSDREIFDRARALDCYLWMNTPDFVLPREPSLLGDVAGCFDAVAEAVALVRGMLPDLEVNREFYEPALDLLAEAQSALRVSIDRIDGPNDPDQYRVYDWLRGVAAREQIYIRRHMRLDDPAEPALLSNIAARIEALESRFQEIRNRSRKKKSRLNQLRYHAKLIADGTGGEHDWRKVAGAIAEMIGEGIPASSVEIREVLLPILEDMPDLDRLPPEFGIVLREIDRYLAGRVSSPEITAGDIPTPEVSQASRLLTGKAVVLIGGSRRPEAYEALKAAFGLHELFWVETREHESIDKFEPYVARQEVALVLLAIRWSSHSFGDVKRFCDRYGKPMVRLPGGYSPNQVAVQILAQVSGQLGDKD
jgi:hypothetical protein